VLDKAFNKDKAHQGTGCIAPEMVEKPKKETLELKEEIPWSPTRKQDDEKEVSIKSNIVSKEKDVEKAPKAEAAQPQVDKHETEAPKLDGPKIVGKVDLTKPKKTTKKAAKEEPKEEVVPVAEPEVIADSTCSKEDVVDENHIQTKRVALDGPKTHGQDRAQTRPLRAAP